MPKKLKDAPGIVPAMDMPLGRALIEMDKLKELKDEITGFKIGSEIRDMNGYPTMRRLFDDIGIEIPTIMDGQKDGTDIPDLITGQVERAAKIGRFDAYIGSPLGSGSNIGSEKKGSLEAFVDACYEQEIVPIIVLEMTQPGSTRYSDLEKCELLARDAKDLGVYNLTAAKRPDGKPGAFIGITQPYKTYYEPNPMAANFAGGLNFLMSLLTWVFILSIGIGVVNLLPIKPFDGGLILEAVVQKFSKKKSGTKIANLVSIIVGLALIFNIIGPYIV